MKVSVSVVTYQHAATVQQALDSVLMQETNFDYEVIVGDDASTDGTREVLDTYRSKAPTTVRVLQREINAGDFGLTNVMATIDAAHGEYVAFLDGDDYWTDPCKLQKQVDFLDRNPKCMICSHRVLHQCDDGSSVVSSNAPRGGGVYDVGALIRRNFAPKISTVVRSSALADLPSWYRTNDFASADWVLNVLASRQGRVGFIDEIMAIHRIHQASVSAGYGADRMLSDKLRAIPVLRDCIPQSGRDLDRLERNLIWKRRVARWSPRAFLMLKQLAGNARSRPTRSRPN